MCLKVLFSSITQNCLKFLMLAGVFYYLSHREQWDQFWIGRMKPRHKLLCVSSLVSNFVQSNFKAFEKFIFTETIKLPQYDRACKLHQLKER